MRRQGTWFNLLPCFLLSLLAGCNVTYGSDAGLERYETMMMRDLYKRLSQLDLPLYLNDLPNDFMASQDGGEFEGDVSGAALRDAELIEHSSAAHYPIVSDQLNEKEAKPETNNYLDKTGGSEIPPIKVDSTLPSYCHPPNPCPKGLTEKDGCDIDVENSAEEQKDWITTQQQLGYCTCDREHMYNCPAEAETVVSQTDPKQAINAAVNSILADRAEPVYLTGEKRKTLVAKKAPRIKRETGHHYKSKKHVDKKHSDDMKRMMHDHHEVPNPYLQGDRLRTVAKKG